MTVRATRWLLFAALALALPLPMLGPFDAFVPPVRFAILLAAASAVALAEGAAGPVPGILLLLAGNLLLSLAVVVGLAWGAARALSRLGPARRGGIAVALVLALLAMASFTDLYETGFGRTPRANLFGLLH